MFPIACESLLTAVGSKATDESELVEFCFASASAFDVAGAMLQLTFTTTTYDTPCLSVRINRKSADVPAFTDSDRECPLKVGVPFCREDALKVVSASPYNQVVLLSPCRLTGNLI